MFAFDSRVLPYGVLAAAVCAACNMGTLPQRYADRPLLTPDDQHQLSQVVARPLGDGSAALNELEWRFGLGQRVNLEFPGVIAIAPFAASDARYVLRLGVSDFGVVSDEVAQDDPRQKREKRDSFLAIVRLGHAGRFPLSESVQLVVAAHVDRIMRPDQDAHRLGLALSLLFSTERKVSFAPGLAVVEQWDGVLSQERSGYLVVGQAGTDGYLPYGLFTVHVAQWLDLGLGARLLYEISEHEVEGDALFNVELHWD